MEEAATAWPEYEQYVRVRCVDVVSLSKWPKHLLLFTGGGESLCLCSWVPRDTVVRWVQLLALSERARVGLNGKHTFLITGPLTDFLLSNENPKQWKIKSSRKLGAMNYRIPNKYVSEGNDHHTVLSEGVAGHGWLLCFFSQGMWALFLYIALHLRASTLGSLLMELWWFFYSYFHHAIFQLWQALVFAVGIKKISGERISYPALPLAVVALDWCSPCLPHFFL